MILQLGSILTSVFGGAPGASFGSIIGGAISRGVGALAPIALGVGEQFATGLINRELSRSSRNDFEDAIKAQLRAAANAISPTAAPGQTAVPSGGPAIGSPFDPATLLPPSIQPPQRILQTNPNFFGSMSGAQFQTTRRPPDLFAQERLVFPGGPPTTNVGLGTAILQGGRAIGQFAGRFGNPFKAGLPRAMAGVTAGGVAVDTALTFGADAIFNPSFAGEGNGFGRFPTSGDPLRIGGSAMPGVSTAIPTGLPRTGNFQREPNGFQVQWFFWDGNMGTQPQPIDRGQASCLKRDCIFRLNVFTGKFIKLKGRRMNPMNVRAFFRAGRRVDSGERICRKMFSEHRKTKTGTVRRKRSRTKKR